METYSPIIIFAFNRLAQLKVCVSSLLQNKGVEKSDLIVYVDGPRKQREREEEQVESVRQYVKTIKGFKSLTYHFSDNNKGLANSIISGVTQVINQYGKAIIIEDDLCLAPSFLEYMNQMLSRFENDERIFQVSGYGPYISKQKMPLSDVYLNRRGQCWSWGTWKNRWELIDWNITDFDSFSHNTIQRKEWAYYGHDLYGMLCSWKKGKLNSWWIRFSYNMFKQNRFAVCPIRSLVRNDGFGPDSTHCNTYNRYKIDFDNSVRDTFNVPTNIVWDRDFNHYATRYWHLSYRIYGKVMTYFYRFLSFV